jgi:hypothetical protein
VVVNKEELEHALYDVVANAYDQGRQDAIDGVYIDHSIVIKQILITLDFSSIAATQHD